MIDEKAIQEAVAKIIVAIGEDPQRDGLLDTPRRVAEMYKELFSGLYHDPREELKVGYELGHRELV
ncbi:MAG: GTP cyclohydrolase I, partial [Dehalococcoidia bacterium]|nr:GTP cyclohydrolase I [Dehalococcoidia bacterium]